MIAYEVYQIDKIMKTLHTKEWVAVGVSIAFLAYLFFSAPILNFFNSSMNTQQQATAGAASAQGVQIQEVAVGTGLEAQAGDTITAHYVGKLTDGRVFDSSLDRGTPISFMLGTGQVIRGWDEGLKGMKEGGRRILTISPEYGYGANAVGAIPANSTLIFEVELLKVQKGS